MQVTVPAGVSAGMPFVVNTPAGQMQVTCPPGASAGGQMIVNVPAAPAPMVMAQEAPMVVAEQVFMGQALEPMAQPLAPVGQPVGQPMATPATNSGPPGQKVWSQNLNLDNKSKVADAAKNAVEHGAVPPSLLERGVTPNDYVHIAEQLDKVQRANFFYDCPSGSMCECCYFCCPGGPLQALLCICNPVTCILCLQPVEKAKEAGKSALNAPVLYKYGLELKYADTANGLVANLVSIR